MRLSDIDKNVSRVTEGILDNPGAEDSPVAQAIIRRILLQRTDLLAKYGPERVGAAVDEVADFVGDVDEIGSSDVSGWIRHVEQMLGNMEEGVAEGSEQVYNIVAVDKGNAMSKPKKLTYKAGSIEEVFDALAANDWYPLEINGVEVINGKHLKQGVAEADDIQYHQTSGTKAGHTVSSRKLSNKPQASKSDVTLQSGSMHHIGKSYNFPKGTVFTQLPGGIFAKHPSVPETHPGFGHLIRKSEDNIHAIHSALTGEQGVAEVSKATLDRYVPKAVDAHGHADFSARQSKGDPTKRSYHVDQKRTAEKRRQGISRALDRMSKMEGVVEVAGANKTHLAMAYLKAVVMAPMGTPEKRRILNWQQILSNQFDIEMDTAVLAKMLPQLDSQLKSGQLDKLETRMASRGELYIESVAEGTGSVNVGDDVIITGAVKYKGATGVVDSVGRDGDFIVVNLYNHGKQSFQSTDVSPNDYAGSEAEESEIQRREMGESNSRSALGKAIRSSNIISEAAKGHTVEAHGVKGMKNTAWRKTFKNAEQAYAWAEKNDAEVKGTRDLEAAKTGNLSPAVKEGAKTDRMVKHITKSEKASGKSSAAAEDIAWATANKRGKLDNKNKKTESTKARANKKY